MKLPEYITNGSVSLETIIVFFLVVSVAYYLLERYHQTKEKKNISKK